MKLSMEKKKAIVAEVAEVANHAYSAIAAEYAGLTVADMTRLRQSARNADVYLRVVRNTLARRALDGTKFACMREKLVGPLLLAFSRSDPGAAAKIIRDFAKSNERLVVKLVSLDGKLLDASAIDALASLPTRDEAIARLMAVMLAPVATLVRTLAAPHIKLVLVLAAIRDQKQQAA